MVVLMNKILHELVWPKHHHYWDAVFLISTGASSFSDGFWKKQTTQTLGKIIIGSVRDPFGEFMIVICCHLLDL